MKNYIKEIREFRNKKLAELAAQIGTNQVQISRLESGERRLNGDWIEKIATALNVKPSQLLDENWNGKPILGIKQEDLIEIISIIEEVLSERHLKMTTIDKIKLAYALFEELEQKQTHTAKILYISDYLNNKKSA